MVNGFFQEAITTQKNLRILDKILEGFNREFFWFFKSIRFQQDYINRISYLNTPIRFSKIHWKFYKFFFKI